MGFKVFVLLAAILLTTSQLVVGDWAITTIAADGTFPSLHAVNDGVLHLSYVYGPNGIAEDLVYGKLTDGAWNFVTVDQSGEVKWDETHLVLDSLGYPHVVYRRDSSEVWFASGSFAGWSIDSLFPDSDGPPRVAIDGSNGLYLSFPEAAPDRLQLAYKNVASWQLSNILEHNTKYTSIAVEPDASTIHIVWEDAEGSHTLRYTWGIPGSWQTATIDSSAGEPSGVGAGSRNSMAMGDNGWLHVAYLDTAYQQLKYAWNSGAGWITYVVEDLSSVGGMTAIAVDSQGLPHISYYDPDLQCLKHAYTDGSGWEIEIVDSEGNPGPCSSIAISPDDTIYIAYRDYSSGVLKLATTGAVGSTYTVEYVVAHWVSGAVDTNDACEINLDQILQAIAWWADASEVPETGGETINLDKILDLIAKWAAATCIDDPYNPMRMSHPQSSNVPMDDSTAVSVSRTITPSIADPGDTVRVEVTVQAHEDISGLGLDEDLIGLPADWSPWAVSTVDTDGASYNAAEKQWLWLSLHEGDTKTLIYDITIPGDAATGLHEIAGTAQSASLKLDEAISGDQTILVGEPGDATGDGVVDICDIRLCYQIAAGVIEGTAFERAIVDLNADGIVDQADLELMLSVD